MDDAWEDDTRELGVAIRQERQTQGSHRSKEWLSLDKGEQWQVKNWSEHGLLMKNT